MHNGKAGEIYNAGGNCEVKKIELILKIMRGKMLRFVLTKGMITIYADNSNG